MAFTFDGENSKGALLALPDGTLLTDPDPVYPLVVTKVTTNFSENAQFLKCFNDKIYTYAFGANVGSLTLEFLGFLSPGIEAGGKGGGGSDDPFQITFDAYKEARLSKSLDFATLTIGKTSFLGLVMGLSTGTASSEYNMQTFSITMVNLPEESG